MKSISELMESTHQSMMKKDSGIDTFGNVIIDKFLPLLKNESIRDNMIYCDICGGNKIYVGNDWNGNVIARRCVCSCYEKEQQRLRAEEELRLKRQRINRLKEKSLMDERYKDKRFSDLDLSDSSFEKAYNRCKKYCEVSEEVFESGYGIYLFGNSGTGKTLLTSCMANELMEKEYTVLFTNFFEILKAIRNTYNGKTNETDESVINSIADVDFLFIDDLGTESLTKNSGDNFTQDKIFEIINKRYNKKKPTIFSSNYSIGSLTNERNLMGKTTDRIYEMSSAIIKIECDSYRTKKSYNKKIPF